jgi:heavy metal translocating P-type ATPase
MSEKRAHVALLALALAGLLAGIALRAWGEPWAAVAAWSAATIPVIVYLAVAIVRDFLVGRVGVDAIALVAMAAGVALGEPLAGVVVAVMYTGGNLLEDYARDRAERDLKALRDRTPRVAHRWRGGALRDVAVDAVAPGDELLVRAGELLPVDGRLLDAEAMIDESAVTGEPLPVTRRKGDRLQSGTVNAGEAFRLHAEAAASASTYAGIVRLVEAAQTAKAPFIRVADRFALVLLPLTLIAAGLAWALSGDPTRALAVLVVATPCPLILAAPVAFIGGVARAARAGILMKGGAALEALAGARTALFDKTGTLTEGGARVIGIATAPGVAPDEALRLLASLEQASHHVVAAALVEFARSKGLALAPPAEAREYRGSGLEGVIEGRHLRAGSRRLVLGEEAPPSWAGVPESTLDRSGLSVYLAEEGKPIALVTMADTIREESPAALKRLRALGISRIVMLTGDDPETARSVAAALGIEEALADQSPADKIAVVEAERRMNPTMMVGDGINDAPALAAASVGIAMGARGATASSEAADVVILVDRLDRVAEAYAIAHRTRAIAMQSIIAGLALSGAGMIAAAFGFLAPVAGALLQEAIDVAVILNALRALGPGHARDPHGPRRAQDPVIIA